jgi:hypothetical protein
MLEARRPAAQAHETPGWVTLPVREGSRWPVLPASVD